jgi:hypothetical protein
MEAAEVAKAPWANHGGPNAVGNTLVGLSVTTMGTLVGRSVLFTTGVLVGRSVTTTGA